MVYILETEILDSKPLIFSLGAIYGLGRSQSIRLCRKLGFSQNLTISDLSRGQLLSLIQSIERSELSLANNLRKIRSLLLQQKVSIKCYRGLRIIRGLPVRGQRTHTNAKTVKRFKIG